MPVGAEKEDSCQDGLAQREREDDQPQSVEAPVPTAQPGATDSQAAHSELNEAQSQPHIEAESDADDEEEEEETGPEDASDLLAAALAYLRLGAKGSRPEPAPPQHAPETLDLQGIADLITSGKVKRVVCMCGAGISVSAGIPDFRTPGTGLYSQLAEYNLPYPEAVFTLDFFRRNPEPFHRLARELFPGCYKPTPTHYFMSLLHKKGLLLRCYTQNIDSLETLAGLPADKVVAAHGNFDSASCISCGASHTPDWVKQEILAERICRCTSCGKLVKPDIVFFGENLPERFARSKLVDLPQCDLLIVMGTSLVVFPFAGLIYEVHPWTPRLLINRDTVGEATPYDLMYASRKSTGFQFDDPKNIRDVLFQGDCDDGVTQLAGLIGWGNELQELIQEGHASMSAALQESSAVRSLC